MVLMHANVMDAEKKQSRSVPATSVVMADGKRGEEEEKRSHNVKQKKEEIMGCFEVMKFKKLWS